jgi:hypothetical protein
MTEIDRRSLVTLAGAGLLVAACNRAGSNKPDEPSKGTGDTGLFGDCPVHGDSVTATAPAGFAAKLLCVVYIQFPPTGGGPDIQQKYVLLTGTESDNDIRTMVQHVLEQIKGINHSITYYRERYDFQSFSFDRPTYVAFYLDNAETQVKFNWSTVLSDSKNKEHILRFTRYSGHPGYPGEPIYNSRKKNKNFYGIERWTFSNPSVLASDKVVSVKFYNRNEALQQIGKPDHTKPSTWYIYSMNIHLQMATLRGTMFPLILDPDTGNMGSDP